MLFIIFLLSYIMINCSWLIYGSICFVLLVLLRSACILYADMYVVPSGTISSQGILSYSITKSTSFLCHHTPAVNIAKLQRNHFSNEGFDLTANLPFSVPTEGLLKTQTKSVRCMRLYTISYTAMSQGRQKKHKKSCLYSEWLGSCHNNFWSTSPNNQPFGMPKSVLNRFQIPKALLFLEKMTRTYRLSFPRLISTLIFVPNSQIYPFSISQHHGGHQSLKGDNPLPAFNKF